MWIFIGKVSSLLLSTTNPAGSEYKRYLGIYKGNIRLVTDENLALNFNTMPGIPDSTAIIFSTGTKALFRNEKEETVELKELNRKDPFEKFEMLVTPDNTHLLRNEDKCLISLDDVGRLGFGMCDDMRNRVEFTYNKGNGILLTSLEKDPRTQGFIEHSLLGNSMRFGNGFEQLPRHVI